MKDNGHRVCGWLASLVVMATGAAHAGVVDVRVPPGGDYSVRVVSVKEARFRTTVRQQYDFSCGSAATATLLTFQYGMPVSEAEVFMQMYARGDRPRSGARDSRCSISDATSSRADSPPMVSKYRCRSWPTRGCLRSCC